MLKILFTEEEEIEFSAIGTGSSGEMINYHFILEFFLPVKREVGKLDKVILYLKTFTFL